MTPIPITDVAAELGVSVKTVRRLIARRRLAKVQYEPRGKIYIDPDELARFRAASTTPTKGTTAVAKSKPRAKLGGGEIIPRNQWGKSGRKPGE